MRWRPQEGRFDYLLIEATGISEPLPIAMTSEFANETGASLADVARLDTVVTVVDALNLLQDFSSHNFLPIEKVMGEADERALVNLLTDQIEFADVIVLNKCSDAGSDRVDAAHKIIRALNRDARVIETHESRVVPGDILNTGLFDFERAHEHPKRAIEPCGFADHTP